jgi:hypothetical protein
MKHPIAQFNVGAKQGNVSPSNAVLTLRNPAALKSLCKHPQDFRRDRHST